MARSAALMRSGRIALRLDGGFPGSARLIKAIFARQLPTVQTCVLPSILTSMIQGWAEQGVQFVPDCQSACGRAAKPSTITYRKHAARWTRQYPLLPQAGYHGLDIPSA